jgi:hypothetical protein
VLFARLKILKRSVFIGSVQNVRTFYDESIKKAPQKPGKKRGKIMFSTRILHSSPMLELGDEVSLEEVHILSIN